MSNSQVGLGSSDARISVFIGNRPDLAEFESLESITPLLENDIRRISDLTGNHWRKIFNVYAKLMFELQTSSFASWQHYRDERLLQPHSGANLLFSPPSKNHANNIRIITGKTYAEQLGVLNVCIPLEAGFYMDTEQRLIVCPYFDYRQMSNLKIQYLANLITDNFGPLMQFKG